MPKKKIVIDWTNEIQRERGGGGEREIQRERRRKRRERGRYRERERKRVKNNWGGEREALLKNLINLDFTNYTAEKCP